MCDDAWHSVMRLQAAYGTLDKPSVIWVVGTGCKLKDTPEFEKMLSATVSGARRTVVRCEENYDLAVAHTLTALVAPVVTKYVESVLCTVKREISVCGNVLLMGTSYGGLVTGIVSERLKDDPRARERLRVWTFGSMYTPTGFGDVMHFVFTGDEQCMRTNGLRAPAEEVSAVETARFDPDTKVMWLYTYMAPDHRSAWYDPFKMNATSTKIHKAYVHFMKKVLADFSTMSSRDSQAMSQIVFLALRDTAKDYVLLKSAASSRTN